MILFEGRVPLSTVVLCSKTRYVYRCTKLKTVQDLLAIICRFFRQNTDSPVNVHRSCSTGYSELGIIMSRGIIEHSAASRTLLALDTFCVSGSALTQVH